MEYGAVVVWWAALVLLGAVGLPLAASVLRTLPDEGASLALPVAFVVLIVPIYWLGHLHYGDATVAVGAVALAALSVLAHRRGRPVALDRFAEWLLVFTLGFCLVVAIRAVDPAIVPAGGEKFLDFGLLQTLLRGSRLPPEDVWFAGEPVAYYYGGHLLVASISTLTGTPVRLAFNLALAGFYGALVGAAYGVAGSIGASRGHSYRWAGGLGAFFVGIASNAVPFLQAILWVLPTATASRLADAVAARTALPAAQLVSPERFWYWTASRVVPGTINEFPLFSFLNGELHGHAMETVYLVLVAGIGLAYVLTPAGAVGRRRLLVFGAVPPVAGLVALTNTWGFPGAVGLLGLSVLFADAPPRDLLPDGIARRLPPTGGVPGELVRVGAAVIASVAVGVLGLAWVLPFVVGTVTGTSTQSLGTLPDRTGLLPFVLVHGWFLLVYGTYLLARAEPVADRHDERRVSVAIVGAVGFVLVGLAADAAAIALTLPLLAVAWYLLRRDGTVGYETVLFVAGAGLVVLVELLFVQEEAGPGRLNTVFKTYVQVWVFWGIGAGACLAAFVPRPGAISTDRERIAGVALAALLAVASIYGVMALGNHFEGTAEPTLDGTTWARAQHAEEWEAIQFVGGLSGQPTIVTAPGCWCNDVDATRPYRWANAPSTFTGVPTVVGWDHQIGFRGRAAYAQRYDDVRTIYTGSADDRAGLLAEYDVRYVYVGPNERALYDPADLGADPALSVAFENEAVTVYAVDLDAI